MNVKGSKIAQEFSGARGLLCALAAQALTQGHPEESVIDASCGRGNEIAPVYVRLRGQCVTANCLLAACRKAGVSDISLAERNLEVRTAVEQEFMRRIPWMV